MKLHRIHALALAALLGVAPSAPANITPPGTSPPPGTSGPAVMGKPDLTIWHITKVSSMAWIHVKNKGNAKSPACQVWVQAYPLQPDPPTKSLTATIPALAPGETYIAILQFGSFLLQDDLVITAMVDSTKVVSEWNESNNSFTLVL